MAANSTGTASIYGVKETMAALAAVDPALKRALQASMRAAAAPLAGAVSAAMPASPPLSGMARGRLAWGPKDRTAVVRTGGRARGDTIPLVTARVLGGGASMADMAETGALGAHLSARYGEHSRWAWPAAEQVLPAVQAGVAAACDAAAKTVNVRLGHYPAGAPRAV